VEGGLPPGARLDNPVIGIRAGLTGLGSESPGIPPHGSYPGSVDPLTGSVGENVTQGHNGEEGE